MLSYQTKQRLGGAITALLAFGVGFGGGGLAAFFFIGRGALPPRKTMSASEAARRGVAWGGVPLLKPKTREALTQWAVASVWNGVSLPIALVAIPYLRAQGQYIPVVLISLFPLIGMLILSSAISSTVHAFRDGPFNRDWKAT